MKKTQAFDKLLDIVKADLPSLEKNFILAENDSSFSVFGSYRLIKENHGIKVLKYGNGISTFSNKKTALSWCVADKYNQSKLAKEILELDRQQYNLNNDIKTRSQVANQIQQYDVYENVQIKLQQKQHRLREVELRLDKCINLAKYWQLRGFNNEIARTRRTTPQRTIRQSAGKSPGF